MARRVITIALSSITEQPTPRRSLNEAAVASLQESIKAIGLVNPITVVGKVAEDDPRSDHLGMLYELIAGKHRLEAVRRLGQELIEALSVDGSDERHLRPILFT